MLRKAILFFPLIISVLLLHATSVESPSSFLAMKTYPQLEQHSVFSFSIFSDSEGDSPINSKDFASMVEWIDTMHDEFVVGLGDHVKRKDNHNFTDFLSANDWWRNHFYPTAADGENLYYGSSQADWGAGKQFLTVTGIPGRATVSMRENGVEYYAQLKIGKFLIHLIQLHYPDQPEADTLAFRKDSKEYLMEMLGKIKKGPYDIIMVGAHSRTGFWIDQLTSDQRSLVMSQCDLVLSGTTHLFDRCIPKGYENSGALVINSGSATHAVAYCPPGFIHVNVIDNPPALVVQYMNLRDGKPKLQNDDYAYVKYLNGVIISPHFHH